MGSVYNLILTIFSLTHNYVMCQVCEETRSVLREVPETFRFTYVETYEEPCIIFCSVKTRKAVNITTRMVQRYENLTVNVCCNGYKETTEQERKGLYCEPVCDPPCQNGFCQKPNQCACEAGYAPDPLQPNVCKPLCLEGCRIPSCISVKNSQCSGNSSTDIISSQPYCPDGCLNGVCIEPGVCQCLPGYTPSTSSTCEPDIPISYSCNHGLFISPNTCLCDEGWEWKCGSCEPVCEGCEHGICTSPGNCTCEDGFVKNDKGDCEPFCENGCPNGKCVSPAVCSCDVGWFRATEGGECQPHCDMNCNHGDCIAPNICACHVGYQLYINSRGRSRCLPNRRNCTDSSTDPETCECHAPYQISYFKDDGSNCYCVGACADESTKCTNATCLFMNVAPDPNNSPDLDYDYLIDSEEEDYEDNSPTTEQNQETTAADNLDFNVMLMTLLPSIRKEVSEQSTKVATEDKKGGPVARTYASVVTADNVRRKRETVNFSLHWLVACVSVAMVLVLLVLGVIIRRKYCNTQSFDTKGSNDVAIHYKV